MAPSFLTAAPPSARRRRAHGGVAASTALLFAFVTALSTTRQPAQAFVRPPPAATPARTRTAAAVTTLPTHTSRLVAAARREDGGGGGEAPRRGGGGSSSNGPPRRGGGGARGGGGSSSSRDRKDEFLSPDFDLEDLLKDDGDNQAINWQPKRERPDPPSSRAPPSSSYGGGSPRAYSSGAPPAPPARGGGGPRPKEGRGATSPRDVSGEEYRQKRRQEGAKRRPDYRPQGATQAPVWNNRRMEEENDEDKEAYYEEGQEREEEEEPYLDPIDYYEESFAADGPASADTAARLADDFFFSRKAFDEVGASEEARNALQSLGISRPSKIQNIAYPHVLAGTSCILAEQTGSGKTLAYLLPLLQRLRQLEKDGGLGRAPPKSPRVVVLAPTAELASQVAQVARALTRHLPLRVCCVTGGKNPRTQGDMLKAGVDVLIGTPGRVQYLMEEKKVELTEMKALVLDEVDVMFLDDTFDLSVIGAAAPADTQFLFVTATLPVAVADQISKEFPGVKKLWGPGLHKIAPQVEEVLVDCSGPPDEERNEETAFVRKRDMLVQNLLKHPVSRTLVFCNSIPTCRKVENSLRRADRKGNKWQILAYHSAVNPQDREKNLGVFSSAVARPLVLVCTDRTSRGVDFDTADVEHVVLFDFPRDPSEYVRRVGRTGRAGRVGRVTALVLGKQVSLARSIMEGNSKGDRIHPVPS